MTKAELISLIDDMLYAIGREIEAGKKYAEEKGMALPPEGRLSLIVGIQTNTALRIALEAASRSLTKGAPPVEIVYGEPEHADHQGGDGRNVRSDADADGGQ